METDEKLSGVHVIVGAPADLPVGQTCYNFALQAGMARDMMTEFGVELKRRLGINLELGISLVLTPKDGVYREGWEEETFEAIHTVFEEVARKHGMRCETCASAPDEPVCDVFGFPNEITGDYVCRKWLPKVTAPEGTPNG